MESSALSSMSHSTLPIGIQHGSNVNENLNGIQVAEEAKGQDMGEDSLVQVQDLLDTTENNKKRFFQALEEAGIEPNFSVHDEKSFGQEDYDETSFDSFHSSKKEVEILKEPKDMVTLHFDPKESIGEDLDTSIVLESEMALTSLLERPDPLEEKLKALNDLEQEFKSQDVKQEELSSALYEETKSMTKLLDDVLQEIHPSFVEQDKELKESGTRIREEASILEIQEKFGELLDESSMHSSVYQVPKETKTPTILTESLKSPLGTSSTKTVNVLELQLQDEVENLNQTILLLNRKLEESKVDLEAKQTQNETLKQEIVLLESILEKEQENSRLLLSKPILKQDSPKEKEVLELERLLSGYQIENEKLVQQVKDAKKSLLESERMESIKHEKLNREISLLKSELEEKSLLAVDTVPFQKKIQELEAERDYWKELLTEKEGTWNVKLRRMEDESKKLTEQLTTLSRTPQKDSIVPLQTQEDLNAQIKDLESKLDWYKENQELLKDYQTILSQKDAVIQDLTMQLESNKIHKVSGKEQKSSWESQKIVELEAQIKSLKQPSKGKKQDKTQSALELDELKKKVRDLESQLEQQTLESEKTLRSLQQEFHHVKLLYEKQIQELEKDLETIQSAQSRDQQILDLQEQLKNALKLAAISNESLTETNSMEETRQKRRILELESLVDEQSRRLDVILKDKSVLEDQLLSRIQEKDALIESYETRIFDLQTAFKDKIFLANEVKNMEETNRLVLELEACQREISGLKSKLEISEETRKSVHATTLSILKSAQEESAKIALDHHQQSMATLLNELKQESLKFSSQIHHKELESTKAELAKTTNTVKDLRDKLQESQRALVQIQEGSKTLQESNQSLVLENQEIKKGWPHSMRILESKLKSLEDLASKREMEIQSLIQFSREDAAQAFEQERQEFNMLLYKKDQEILGFKKELETMIASVLEWKQSQRLL